MKGLNKAQLIGRLGKDPVVRTTQGGQSVASFSIATDETWNDRNGEKQTRTEWHNLVAWGKLAEICGQYLRKGALVYIEGKIQSREYEHEGQQRRVTEVILSDLSMLESKKERSESPAPQYPYQPNTQTNSEYDDVPF